MDQDIEQQPDLFVLPEALQTTLDNPSANGQADDAGLAWLNAATTTGASDTDGGAWWRGAAPERAPLDEFLAPSTPLGSDLGGAPHGPALPSPNPLFGGVQEIQADIARLWNTSLEHALSFLDPEVYWQDQEEDEYRPRDFRFPFDVTLPVVSEFVIGLWQEDDDLNMPVSQPPDEQVIVVESEANAQILPPPDDREPTEEEEQLTSIALSFIAPPLGLLYDAVLALKDISKSLKERDLEGAIISFALNGLGLLGDLGDLDGAIRRGVGKVDNPFLGRAGVNATQEGFAAALKREYEEFLNLDLPVGPIDAHHILPKAAANNIFHLARGAYDAMRRLGLDVNNTINGVFLPRTFHSVLQTREYESTVGQLIAQTAARGGEPAVREMLADIANELDHAGRRFLQETADVTDRAQELDIARSIRQDVIEHLSQLGM